MFSEFNFHWLKTIANSWRFKHSKLLHLHLKNSKLSYCQIETPIKNTRWINNIRLHRNYHWQTVLPFSMTAFRKGKKDRRHGNPWFQHVWHIHGDNMHFKVLRFKNWCTKPFCEIRKNIQVWNLLPQGYFLKTLAC